MPLFAYAGLNSGGKKQNGTIEASGKRIAQQRLREQGIFVTTIEEVAEGRTRSLGVARLLHRRRLSGADLASITRQLGTLVGAGLPLDESLRSVAEQQGDGHGAVILQRARESVMEGSAFHLALRASGAFPDLMINMVEVGESSGTLDQVLHRLADYMEEQERIKGKISAAMFYPVMMLLVGFGVLSYLMTAVVPKVTSMLESMGQTLPLATRLLISLSHLFAGYWYLMMLALAGGLYVLDRYYRSPQGRITIDRLLLRLPLFGPVQLQIVTSRMARTLSTLLQSGVHLLAALEIASRLVGNRILQQAVSEAVTAVREGEGLTGPLKRSGLFPPLLTQLTAAGEKSGALDEMLGRAADTFDRQVESSITGLISLLEPVMILVMGGLIGFIVASILLPIFQASQGIG